MHQASTFHQLHEAALIKETTGMTPAPASLPPTSYRWTWGEELTEDDVLALRRPGTRICQALHSGYDLSLREGWLTGEQSPAPSTVISHGCHEDLPAQVSSHPPHTELTYMPYLANFGQLVYDPLSRSPTVVRFPLDQSALASARPSSQKSWSSESVALAPAAEGASAHVASDDWPLASGEEAEPLSPLMPGQETASVAHSWSSASDVNVSAPVSPAHSWSSACTASNPVSHLAMPVESTPAPASQLHSWSAASDQDPSALAADSASSEHSWSSESEDEQEPGSLVPASRLASWSSASTASNPVSQSAMPVGESTPAPASLVYSWSAASDQDPSALAADSDLSEHSWSSESEDEQEPGSLVPASQTASWSSASNNSTDGLTKQAMMADKDWPSATIESDTAASVLSPTDTCSPGGSGLADNDAQSSPNSQCVVSPSRITMHHPAALPRGVVPFNFSHDRPPTLDSPDSRPSGGYGPEDFAFLQDDMFEDELSDEEEEGSG
ncbi:hypothetical protein BYT27DRAFT_7249120 [Phlegmacium glaucopus]|nr:hypothetical protein BYT27DRAFT_7249120 [Phlegmacium glaucopus]